MKLSDNRFRLEILRMFEYRPEGGRDCEGDRRSGLPGAAVWLMGFGESEAALGYRLTKQTGSRWSRTAFGPCIHYDEETAEEIYVSLPQNALGGPETTSRG